MHPLFTIWWSLVIILISLINVWGLSRYSHFLFSNCWIKKTHFSPPFFTKPEFVFHLEILSSSEQHSSSVVLLPTRPTFLVPRLQSRCVLDCRCLPAELWSLTKSLFDVHVSQRAGKLSSWMKACGGFPVSSHSDVKVKHPEATKRDFLKMWSSIAISWLSAYFTVLTNLLGYAIIYCCILVLFYSEES